MCGWPVCAQEEVNRVHAQYFAALSGLFEIYKGRFGMAHTTLVLKAHK